MAKRQLLDAYWIMSHGFTPLPFVSILCIRCRVKSVEKSRGIFSENVSWNSFGWIRRPSEAKEDFTHFGGWENVVDGGRTNSRHCTRFSYRQLYSHDLCS
jgi:hypothetical protein